MQIAQLEQSGKYEITTSFVEAAGARIAVHRSGSGPAIVGLHAIGHSARDFHGLMRRFADSHAVVAIDWPGHGDSPNDVKPVSADRYAEVLVDLLRILNLGRAVLVGNSVGGAAAIKAAADQPAMVRALILCDPAGLQRVGFVSRLYCRSKARFFAKGERGDPGFAHQFRRYYERSVLTEPAASARREEIIASGYKVAPALRQAWQSFAEQAADIRALTPRLQCSVLYAWARKDRIVAFSRCKEAVAATPQHEVVMFDESHTAFLEQPGKFEAAMAAFLQGIPGEQHRQAASAGAR